MIKWYLVLYFIGTASSMTAIPTPYQTKQACENAATDWTGSHTCIKAIEDNFKGYVCQPGANVCQVVK